MPSWDDSPLAITGIQFQTMLQTPTHAVSTIHEGSSQIEVRLTLSRPLQISDFLQIQADLNFNNQNDEGETIWSNDDIIYFIGTHEVVASIGLIADDGPWPGNGRPQDDLKVTIQTSEETIESEVIVKNVPPVFASVPTIEVTEDTDGNRLLNLSVSVIDPGRQDQLRMIANWADGETTTGEWSPNSQFDMMTLTRMIPAGAALPEIYPLTLMVHDDDIEMTNGEFNPETIGLASSQITVTHVDVAYNNDDDDGNHYPDAWDQPDANGITTEDDLLPYSLAEILPQSHPQEPGHFVLNYDPSVIRVWTTANKTGWIRPQNFSEHADTIYGDNEPLEGVAYGGQAEVFIEGVGITPHHTAIQTAWIADDSTRSTQGIFSAANFATNQLVIGGTAHIDVWGIDLDIDSDNNDGFNPPAGDRWEEYLEDNEYGIGKLIYATSTNYVPIRLRLPSGIDQTVTDVRVRIDFHGAGQSGVIHAWNTEKSDPGRSNTPVASGGNRLSPYGTFTLDNLHYNPINGEAIAFLEAKLVFPNHDTKKDVDDYGKPNDRIQATLVHPARGDLSSDEIKFMIANPNSFYPSLSRPNNKGQQIRNALASEAIYPYSDAPEFALQMLSETELTELGIPITLARLLVDDANSGFKAAIYREHVSGLYIVTFAGTDDLKDILVDVTQGLGGFSQQYQWAAELGAGLSRVDELQGSLVTTGHSLGGGLAAMASIAGNLSADTFNAAGLHRNSLLLRDNHGELLAPEQEIFPGILERYNSAGMGLIEAYHLDWDLLSAFQYSVNINPQFIQDAIGKRIVMDGPVDFELTVSALSLSAKVASGAGVLSIIYDLGSVGYIMGLAHTTLYYQYGVFTDEATGWDIYGYDL